MAGYLIWRPLCHSSPPGRSSELPQPAIDVLIPCGRNGLRALARAKGPSTAILEPAGLVGRLREIKGHNEVTLAPGRWIVALHHRAIEMPPLRGAFRYERRREESNLCPFGPLG